LVKHNGRFYVYIPARTPTYRSNYVIHSEKITGPWSEPVDLELPDHIDPGHVVGEDGKRYLFYHHNVAGDSLSLRPAIYAAGAGEVRIRDVHYTAL
jgi:beta-xylosidase